MMSTNLANSECSCGWWVVFHRYRRCSRGLIVTVKSLLAHSERCMRFPLTNFFAIAAVFVTVACTNEQPIPAIATADDAIRIAEEFVIANGYTTEPADPSKFRYGTLEFESDRDELLKRRRGTIEPEVYAYEETSTGWWLYFKKATLTAPGVAQSFRVVRIDKTTNEPIMEHSEQMPGPAAVIPQRGS